MSTTVATDFNHFYTEEDGVLDTGYGDEYLDYQNDFMQNDIQINIIEEPEEIEVQSKSPTAQSPVKTHKTTERQHTKRRLARVDSNLLEEPSKNELDNASKKKPRRQMNEKTKRGLARIGSSLMEEPITQPSEQELDNAAKDESRRQRDEKGSRERVGYLKYVETKDRE